MRQTEQHPITRSPGICINGYIAGGGLCGITQLLDESVQKAAELLRDHYQHAVTIRFNSDRHSGGAWLVDSVVDRIGANSSIGLGARVYNKMLSEMPVEEVLQLSRMEHAKLASRPDSICFTTYIDLAATENTVDASSFASKSSDYRSYSTLEEAAAYLFAHVSGLKTGAAAKRD